MPGHNPDISPAKQDILYQEHKTGIRYTIIRVLIPLNKAYYVKLQGEYLLGHATRY